MRSFNTYMLSAIVLYLEGHKCMVSIEDMLGIGSHE